MQNFAISEIQCNLFHKYLILSEIKFAGNLVCTNLIYCTIYYSEERNMQWKQEKTYIFLYSFSHSFCTNFQNTDTPAKI